MPAWEDTLHLNIVKKLIEEDSRIQPQPHATEGGDRSNLNAVS